MSATRLIQVPVIALGAVLVGCDAVNDYIPSVRAIAEKAEGRRSAHGADPAENAGREEGERAALRQHLEASCKALEALRADCSRKAEAAAADRRLLAGRIKEISSAQEAEGRIPERHAVLSGLLADDIVNALAAKYMERDFRMARLEFVETADAAKAMARRRDEALDRNRQDYDKAVSEGADGAERARQASQKLAEGLRREIADLERREKELLRSMSMSSAVQAVRSQKEKELRNVSDRLQRLRRSYDEVRANGESGGLVAQAAQQTGRNLENARRIRDQADAQVSRSFAGVKSLSAIVSACEDQTVGELERRIIAQERGSKAVCGEVAEDLGYLRDVASGLDKLSLPAVQRVRADVEARIARSRVGK